MKSKRPQKKTPTMIECPTCKTPAKVPLGDELQATLDRIKPKMAFTAAQLHEKSKDCVSVNAMNNRLEKLRELSLLTRTRRGRNWLYALPA